MTIDKKSIIARLAADEPDDVTLEETETEEGVCPSCGQPLPDAE